LSNNLHVQKKLLVGIFGSLRPIKKDLLFLGMAVLFSCFLLQFLIPGANFAAKLSNPIIYDGFFNGDALEVYESFRNFRENGSFVAHPQRDALNPDSLSLASMPNLDLVNYAQAAFTIHAAGNLFVAVNMFIALNIVLSTLLGYVCLRLYNILPPVAAVIAIMMAFSPYVIYRLSYGHLFLTSVWIFPAVFAVAKTKSNIAKAGVGFVLGGLGPYYLFYGAISFLILAWPRQVNLKSWFDQNLAFFCGVVWLPLISLNIFLASGDPIFPLVRGSLDSLKLGLQPWMMLLPTYFDLIPSAFQNFLWSIYGAGGIINENLSSAFGMLPWLLLFLLTFNAIWRLGKNIAYEALLDSVSINARELCVAIVLLILFSSGGLVILVSELTGGMLRSNTRVSIVLYFLFLIFIGKGISGLRVATRNAALTASLIYLIFSMQLLEKRGLYDSDTLRMDEEFVQSVNSAALKVNSVVLSLPAIHYPESGSLHTSYNHNTILRSNHFLRTTYGAKASSEEMQTQLEIQEFILFSEDAFGKEIAKRLSENGIDLLAIDFFGYKPTSQVRLLKVFKSCKVLVSTERYQLYSSADLARCGFPNYFIDINSTKLMQHDE